MTTHAIILGGILKDSQGRPLGPYRLRTAASRAGYNVLPIDFAWALDANKLLLLLESCIDEQTLIFGISSVWFTSRTRGADDTINQWFCDEFFDEFQRRWPWVKVIIGGTKESLSQGSEYLQRRVANSWWLIGFADIGFVKLLDHLSGKGDIIYEVLPEYNIKVVDCNKDYRITNMDELETEFRQGDHFLSFQPVSLEISRGCIFTCSFCTHPFLGKKHYEYIRSPESIAKELRRNYELFGTTRYQLMDDTLNDSMEKLDRIEKAIELSKIPNFEFASYIRAELLVTKPEMIPKLRQIGIRGAQVGIESLNAEARRSIGKGMDIERVMEALAKLKQDTRALIATGMIIGLPGDTLEDPLLWVERFRKDKILSDWTFQPLGMIFDHKGNGMSIFDKDPTKWGYVIERSDVDAYKELGRETGPMSWQWRSNTGVRNRTAEKVAVEINEESVRVNYAGGFDVGGYWQVGAKDHELDTVTRWNMAVGPKAIRLAQPRINFALEKAKRIVESKKNTP